MDLRDCFAFQSSMDTGRHWKVKREKGQSQKISFHCNNSVSK